ncbi:MAG: redoxin domain-containing protein [Patescibacteria group bacterium]
MKKNKFTTIALIVIIIFVLGGLFFLGRNGKGSQLSGSDPMHTPVAGDPGSLNNLIGKPMLDFSLRDRNGTEYSAIGLKGKKIALFFSEGIMCYPACWNQMVALATDPRFNNADTAVLSVVIDPPSDWQSAIQKMPELGKATVLFDSDKSVSQALGMLTLPSSMHYGAFPGHSFILIDKQGIVRDAFDDPTMGIDNDRVFAELEKLN